MTRQELAREKGKIPIKEKRIHQVREEDKMRIRKTTQVPKIKIQM